MKKFQSPHPGFACQKITINAPPCLPAGRSHRKRDEIKKHWNTKNWVRAVFFLFLVFVLITPVFAADAPAFQADAAYGKLTVYSDIPGSDIYVDAKFVGQDRAMISNIPVGKHYVRVVKNETTIQSGLVDVKEGEETIIVAKPSEDELLSKIKKPNQVLLFGGMTSVGYDETNPSGSYSLSYRMQLGMGTEVKFAIPLIDSYVNLGFFLNYPSTITSGTTEGQMAISSPYVCISKDLFKSGPLKFGAGLGLNYGIFNPGGSTMISIASRIGYMYYFEGFRNVADNQQIAVRIGYIIYNGKSATKLGPGDVSCAGFFLQGGVSYQL